MSHHGGVLSPLKFSVYKFIANFMRTNASETCKEFIKLCVKHVMSNDLWSMYLHARALSDGM